MKVSDGAELWTTSSGSGSAVVNLHSGPGLWDYFEPIASESDGSYTVAQAVDDMRMG